MAFEADLHCIPGLSASADLSGKQFYFVKMSGTRTVDVCSGATDKPIGVLQNAPTSGKDAVVAYLGVSKVVASASIAVGALIGTDSAGKAAAKVPGTDTTNYICGQVVLASGANNDVLSAVINCANISRAA